MAGSRRGRNWRLLTLAASLAVISGALGAAGAQNVAAGERGWSAPTVIGECALAVGPRVAFPSNSPSTATGPGAIVWVLGHGGCGGSSSAGSERSGLAVAALGRADRAMASTSVPLGEQAAGGLGVVGASFGRIAAAVPTESSPAATGGVTALLEGRSNHPLGGDELLTGASEPPALTRGYLGDVAIATVVPGPAIAVRTDRYFSRGFAPARLVPIPEGQVTSLTATMDYRSDVLLAWQENGAIYAHMLRASGRPDPTQRIGPSAPYPQLQPLVSDDNQGILAWSTTAATSGSVPGTRTFVDRSALGVRFPAPQLLASFADPQQVGRSPGSLELVRLSTENVMLAWTTADNGHYLVRAAPAVHAMSGPTVRLSDPRRQAVLVGLAPGPDGEAVALWQDASDQGEVGSHPGSTELWAARAFIGPHDRIGSDPSEMVLPAGPREEPAIAVDPASDQAVVAWLVPGARPRVDYAVSLGPAAVRPPSQAAGGSPGWALWLSIALAAAGVLAALVFLALSPWRRHRPRRVSSPR